MTHEERKVRRAAMAEAVQAGEMPNAVAIRFGMSLENVGRACREHGVSAPKEPNPTPHPSSSFRILGLLFAGKTQSEAAEMMGVTRQRINQVATTAAENGIPVPGLTKDKFQDAS